MKVAIHAPLTNLDPTYSIASVALSQSHVLGKAGHEILFMAYEGFQDVEYLPAGTVLRLLPRPADDWPLNRYPERAATAIISLLDGVDLCITHDIVYIPEYRPLCEAIRLAASRLPKMRWLHWCHSSPCLPGDESRCQDPSYYLPISNSRYVTVNRAFVPGFQQMYGLPLNQVKTVHNWLDPTRINAFHPLAAEVYEAMRLWESDFVAVYPTRIAEAKNINKAIKMIAALNRKHGLAKLIVCASHVRHPEPKAVAENLRQLAQQEGLGEKEFLIVSDFQSLWAQHLEVDLEWGVPHQVVSNLMGLSDIFIMPSQAEACSLATLEAAFARNLIIYNSDLPNAEEFIGAELFGHLRERGLAFSFGTDTVMGKDTEPGSYELYAELIVEAQRNDKCLSFFKHVRKEHSPWWIYENQLKPLLFDN